MPLFRLLGFTRLACGCLVARYREATANRTVSYVEDKGAGCTCIDHEHNHLALTDRATESVAARRSA